MHDFVLSPSGMRLNLWTKNKNVVSDTYCCKIREPRLYYDILPLILQQNFPFLRDLLKGNQLHIFVKNLEEMLNGFYLNLCPIICVCRM